MPKPPHRKKTPFKTSITKSVFLYGQPNLAKLSHLKHIESLFLTLVNRYILLLNENKSLFLQIVCIRPTEPPPVLSSVQSISVHVQMTKKF